MIRPVFSQRRRWLAAAVVVGLVGVACLLFPRVLAFAELAARELRYFWWLILLVAVGVWLAVFYKQERR